MAHAQRLPAALALCTAIAALGLLGAPAGAIASTGQEAMFQDDTAVLANPVGTLQRMRLLGVGTVRVFLRWQNIAPAARSRRRPRGFRAGDPAAYPARNWAPYDAIVQAAHADGIKVLFDAVGGAPLWATGPGAPRGKLFLNWEPSGGEFSSFVRAAGTRYSGSYDPRSRSSDPGNANDLPRVSFWSIWNEPDYGPSLAPQGVPGHLLVENSPRLYRALLDGGWSGLRASGHGGDRILFGEVAPRGFPNSEEPKYTFGVFSGMKPLVFLRALYCVDRSYRQLRGSAAAIRGCPTTAAGSRGFRAAHPGLFRASGFADHPYMRWYPPNREAHPDPDYSTLGLIGQLSRSLDRVQGAYGSGARLPIYDTEFGYITSPPKHPTRALPWASQSDAAYFLNWAEYLSWRNPRLRSFEQYLLFDPLPNLASNDHGGFASGLLSYGSGRPKQTYDAWRLPLYLPVTSTTRGRSLEVWGSARAAHFALNDQGGGPQSVEIRFRPRSGAPSFTLQTVPITDPGGYFDVRVKFPSSGTVSLKWTYPPQDQLLVPAPAPGFAIYSRSVGVTIR
ncbi:MAG: hypothetical protein ACR2IP_14615 [Solirubrobacteraceae bacterium]